LSLIDPETLALMRAISSTPRLQILDLIALGHDHPDDLAGKMDATRQAVDKHVQVLMSLGFIERDAVVAASGRAKVIYRVTPSTRELILEIGRLVGEYRTRIEERYKAEREELDRNLAEGIVDEESHARKTDDLRKRFAFVVKEE
jgi:DNA-binding MarR family transcriptional regulator